jgi:hypothetical protein
MSMSAVEPSAIPTGAMAAGTQIGIASTLPVVDDRSAMSLPVENQPWPPTDYAPIAHFHKLWNAWWSGDRQMLAYEYYNLGANSPAARAFFASSGEKGMAVPRPGQYRGGLLGSVEYSFWGDPVPPGEKRTRSHIPIAGDIAQTSASLLFSRPPDLKTTLEGAAGAANQAWLDSLIDDGFHTRLLEAAEMCSALGGVYLRVVWDTTVSKAPWVQAVPVDVGVPSFRYDKLQSVTFWRVVSDNGTDVVRHLEMHVPQQNQIIHGVYQGDQTDLGEVVPLSGFPETARMASDLQGDTLNLPDLPFDASTVVYIPNIKPNKIFRDLGPQAWPVGRSDFQGIEPLMDNLDMVFCADEETEILTDHGWRGYRDVRERDTVLTLNHETGLSEWQPVAAVSVFPALSREMLSIESRSHSSLTTLNHRWAVERPHYRHGRGSGAGTRKDVAGFDRVFATSETLQWEDRIPIAADCADLPEQPKYTDALVEAVAWFWTEGHIQKADGITPGRNVTICQSTAATGNCDRIRSALTRAFGLDNGPFPRMGRHPDPTPRWRESARPARRLTEFFLNAAAGSIVQEHAPGRVPSHAFLLSLTKAQLALFIETSMLADNSGAHSLAQKDPAAAEAFQFACILAGHATSLKPNVTVSQDRGGRDYQMQNVRIRSQRNFRPLKGKPGHGKPQRVTYSGEVWCPTTANGTWLARRRGSVYFTGNSSWMRDVELAVMRLIVPPEYLDSIGRGQGAVFEPDQRVFTPLNFLHDNSAGAPAITANQFKIRWQEHQQTCQDLVNRVVQEAGYSPQSFGDYQGNAPTATEIEARERTSLLTRKKKIAYWRPGLQDIIYSLMCVAQKYFGVTAITPERPDIEFTAVALPDEQALAQTVATLAGAEAASKRTLVSMAHPEWTDEEVSREVAQIISEIGTELAAHAKIALAQPPGTTIQEVEDALTSLAPVEPQEDTGDEPGEEDDG